MSKLMKVYMIARLLDVLTTVIGLNLGAEEANPLIEYMYVNGFLLVGNLTVSYFVARMVKKAFEKYSKTILKALTVLSFLAVGINVFTIIYIMTI